MSLPVVLPPEPLEIPDPVARVKPEQSDALVKVAPGRIAALDAVVAAYVDDVMTMDENGPEFSRKADDVRTMGDKDVRDAATVSNRLLEKAMRDMDGSAAKSALPATLVALRREIEMLDPSQATGTRKFLGLIPFGDALADYFRKYESSQKQLDAIIGSLMDGKDELTRDNADLELEKRNLWTVMQRLREYSYVADRMDEGLAARIAEIAATDPRKAARLAEEVLFYVRQKRQDLLVQQAVSVQGYLAIDLLRRNNIELIKGVDRATTTTVSALRTAVIVSQALAGQKLVLGQITALNDVTNNLIVSTSALLKEQTAEINQQAASSTIDVARLQEAFANVYAALDAVDEFKAGALVSMQATISGLQVEVDKSREYVEKVTRQDGGAADGVALPE